MGVAADSSFVYFFGGDGPHIGRARLDGTGVEPNFIAIPEPFCGLAVDPSFLYWGSDAGNTVGRVPVGGGTPDGSFIPDRNDERRSVRLRGQFAVRLLEQRRRAGASDERTSTATPRILRLITGVSSPFLLAAAPSNKITINSVARKKKKGTATINAKVPGPGQVTLNQTNTPPDVNATAAAVKQVGLTITQASSFKLPVKPKGKTAKKLKKQVKKKGKGKVKVKVFIHFVPAGVAGVPNSEQVTVTLEKKGKKTK